MDYSPHVKGQDVLFMTGIGKIHPFMRSHKMLDSMQHLFEDIPIVMFYPGSFNGQTLILFNEFLDGHYTGLLICCNGGKNHEDTKYVPKGHQPRHQRCH